jgi:four helix bundle protein
VNREPLQRESVTKGPAKVSTFEDLEVYQVARQFRKAMYQVAKSLPDIEKFGLVSQIRRASLSLTNNIAEGHGRFHYPDQIRFMLQSRGSLQELIDDLNTCDDEQYRPNQQVVALKEQGWQVRQLLDGYIRYLRAQMNSGAPRVKEEELPYSEDTNDSRCNHSR